MSSTNYMYTPVRVAVTEQPQPSSDIYPMDPKFNVDVELSEKTSSTHDSDGQLTNRHSPSCECAQHTPQADHRHCHNGRLRRFLVPAVITFIIVSGLMTFACMGGYDLTSWGSDNLVSRALGGATTGNGTNNTFVHRKLYLIVVFVGLFVVVILAICLSAWCCKGAFRNPLCCPCYLCACCGGLACLECIGCGLCAEGLDQM